MKINEQVKEYLNRFEVPQMIKVIRFGAYMGYYLFLLQIEGDYFIQIYSADMELEDMYQGCGTELRSFEYGIHRLKDMLFIPNFFDQIAELKPEYPGKTVSEIFEIVMDKRGQQKSQENEKIEAKRKEHREAYIKHANSIYRARKDEEIEINV